MRPRALTPYASPVTIAIASPSYPLLPTVWIVVALTRRSVRSISFRRRTPRTLGSVLASSTIAPSRITLSTTMSPRAT